MGFDWFAAAGERQPGAADRWLSTSRSVKGRSDGSVWRVIVQRIRTGYAVHAPLTRPEDRVDVAAPRRSTLG